MTKLISAGERLEAMAQRAADAEHRLYAFRQGNAARGRALQQFIKDRAPDLWADYAAISVNGSFYSDDYTLEPVFDREMNILRYRAEDAEKRATEAADRLTAMKAAGDGLAGFAGHTRICAANMFMDEVCTCGLTAALKQWKETIDGL